MNASLDSSPIRHLRPQHHPVLGLEMGGRELAIGEAALYAFLQPIGIVKFSSEVPRLHGNRTLCGTRKAFRETKTQVLDISSQLVEPPGFIPLSLLQRLDWF